MSTAFEVWCRCKQFRNNRRRMMHQKKWHSFKLASHLFWKRRWRASRDISRTRVTMFLILALIRDLRSLVSSSSKYIVLTKKSYRQVRISQTSWTQDLNSFALGSCALNRRYRPLRLKSFKEFSLKESSNWQYFRQPSTVWTPYWVLNLSKKEKHKRTTQGPRIMEDCISSKIICSIYMRNATELLDT